MHKVIVIVGTNASGKSGLAVELAKKYSGEVISADSRQVYKGLDIATGKITKREMRGIPHHLLDVVSPKKMYTAADFARDGQEALIGIIERGNVPIVAGGTGFYIDALLNPQLLAAVPADDQLRARLEKKTPAQLFAQLKKLDPKRAHDIKRKNEQNNARRLIRAIEVAKSTREGPSLPKNTLAFDVLWIGITWEKEELNKRIHERTLTRLRRGMSTEVQTLHEKGLSWKRMEQLGLEYKRLADYLRKRITKDKLIELIEQDDRQYAKSQRTWFKRNTNIHWFDGGNTKGVEKLVRGFLKNT